VLETTAPPYPPPAEVIMFEKAELLPTVPLLPVAETAAPGPPAPTVIV
jgi:hypothetical protein